MFIKVESFCMEIYLLGDLLRLTCTQEAMKTAPLNFILKKDMQTSVGSLGSCQNALEVSNIVSQRK